MPPKFVKHGQRLLCLAQGEDRDENATAASKGGVDCSNKSFLFRRTRPANRRRMIPTGAFHDQHIDVRLRKNGGRHDCLVIKIDVAGIKNGAALHSQKNPGRAKHVSAVPKLESQIAVVRVGIGICAIALSVPAKMPAVTGALSLTVCEKRVQNRAQFLAFSRHDVDRIVQQRGSDLAGFFSHEHARIRLTTHEHR